MLIRLDAHLNIPCVDLVTRVFLHFSEHVRMKGLIIIFAHVSDLLDLGWYVFSLEPLVRHDLFQAES